jgi:hypothetical protein
MCALNRLRTLNRAVLRIRALCKARTKCGSHISKTAPFTVLNHYLASKSCRIFEWLSFLCKGEEAPHVYDDHIGTLQILPFKTH